MFQSAWTNQLNPNKFCDVTCHNVLERQALQRQEDVCGVQHYITLLRLSYNWNMALQA